MTCSYRLRIFSISSQIADSYGIMPLKSLMRSTRSATGDIELDLGRYELRRQGQRVKLEKKPMELLIFLVSRREQLVSRQEIVSKLWGSDLFIDTEPNINNIVRKIRSALDDDSAKPRFLETVSGQRLQICRTSASSGRALSTIRFWIGCCTRGCPGEDARVERAHFSGRLAPDASRQRHG